MKGNNDQYNGLRTISIDSQTNNTTPCKKKWSEDTTDDDKSIKISEKDFREKYKTELCKYWELNNKCKYGNKCAFAHGYDDVRQKVNQGMNYKTKKCKQFFDLGYCSYGKRCQFSHLDEKSVRRSFLSYKQILDILNKELSSFQITDLYSRHRLKTFEALTNNNDSDVETYSSNFIEDINNLKKSFNGGIDEKVLICSSEKKESRNRFLSY